jgi:very-short-patch-repair endonuclease
VAEGVIRTGKPTDVVKTERARQLRKEMTRAERILWAALRGKRFQGLRFRRQEPIAGFIVDFVCVARRLVIELDGAAHATTQAYDQERDTILQSRGLTVLRLPNDLIEQHLPDALDRIAALCDGHPSTHEKNNVS